MSNVILKVENLEKAFGGLKILQGVSFDVKKGQRLALIGPNGAGKSTLLNAIGGQGIATGGKILFEGKNITKMSPNQRLHRGIGRSFQVNNLFWQHNILNNLMLSIYGSDSNRMRIFSKLEKRKDIKEKAEHFLNEVDLWKYRYDFPSSLSYGEQRMLEVAIAFAAGPKMVLLDEPSAGLPTAEVESFTKTLESLAKDTTLLFCAHDMDLVFKLADEIMVLYFCQIIAKGEKKEIANNPKVQEIYLGTAENTYDDVVRG
ncbi:MAG: ABC transporter ATP-binding protein [Lachnospiraceae bacterium]|jgi:branched-chain amino acid transport system ATP-binding protein